MKKDAPRSGLRYLVLLIALFFPVTGAWASVTIVGSRIIYPSTVASVDVQLKNNDDFPYIVQTWFDNGDLHIGPENASGIPFISTPPVFRIQPKSGPIPCAFLNHTRSPCCDQKMLIKAEAYYFI